MCRGIPSPPPYPPPHLGTTVSFQDPCDGFLTIPLLPSLHPTLFSTQLLGRLSTVSEILLLFSSKPSPLTQTGSCSPFHGPRTPSALTLASPCDLITDDPPLDRSASAAPTAIPGAAPHMVTSGPLHLLSLLPECSFSTCQHCLLPHFIHASAKFLFFLN